jgi:hypothetical protein
MLLIRRHENYIAILEGGCVVTVEKLALAP